MLALIPFRLYGIFEKYNVFAILHDSGCGMSLGFLAHRRSQHVEWGFSESSWYTYNLDTRQVKGIEASVEAGPKHQIDGAVLVDHKSPEVPLIFFKGESISTSEARLQVHQLLVSHYPADLEVSTLLAPEEAASVNLLAGTQMMKQMSVLADFDGRLQLK